MATRALDIPVFDADNHLYETQRVADQVPPRPLPGGHRLRRRPGPHQDRGAGPDQRVHPEPDLRRGGPPGRPGGVLPARAIPRARAAGRSSASRCGAIPAFREPGARPGADGRAGSRPDPDVPHPGQPGGGAAAGRPRAHPRRGPRPQRVDLRDLAVRLRGPDLHHAGDHPAHRRPGHRGARVGGRARAPGSSSSARPRCPGFRGPRSFGLPEFDPFWEKVVEHDVLVAMHSSDSGYERYTNDWMGSDSEMLPVRAAGLPHAVGLAAGRGRGRPPWSATARCRASRRSRWR